MMKLQVMAIILMILQGARNLKTEMAYEIRIEGSETSKKSRRLRQKSEEIFQEIWKSEILEVEIYS